MSEQIETPLGIYYCGPKGPFRIVDGTIQFEFADPVRSYFQEHVPPPVDVSYDQETDVVSFRCGDKIIPYKVTARCWGFPTRID